MLSRAPRSSIALGWAFLLLAFWVVLAAVVNPAQFADSIEQFNWAHGVEWGYWKHPPLPTWLMAGWIALAGPSVYGTYSLAALSLAGTAFFTWCIARRLLGARLAAVALLLWGLHLGFSWRAQLYNHNTVLVLAVSAAAWAALRAADRGRLRDWALAGLMAAAAVLTKYQAVVPLAGIVFAVWRTGTLRNPLQRRGLMLALLVFAAACLPHALWAVQNAFPSYRYFKDSGGGPLGNVERLSAWVAFLANQLRFHLPMLGAIGLALLWAPSADVPASTYGDEDTPRPAPGWVRAWFWGLVGIPFIALTLMLLAGGMRLQTYWGLQTLQFLPLVMAWKLGGLSRALRFKSLLIAALLIHAGSAVLYVRTLHQASSQRAMRSADRIYPARQLAAQVQASWEAATNCPLKYVIGPGFEAGLVSVYSGLYPVVLEAGDFGKSPWVDPADLARRGAVVMSFVAPGPLPLGSAPSSMRLPSKQEHDKAPLEIFWHVQPPTEPCAEAH